LPSPSEQAANQPGRDRRLSSACLPSPDGRDRGVDVVRVEVEVRWFVPPGISATLRVVVDLRHAVVHSGHDGLAEAPTEHAQKRCARSMSVWNSTNDLSCHVFLVTLRNDVRPDARPYSSDQRLPRWNVREVTASAR
jgi:hypothetical protein